MVAGEFDATRAEMEGRNVPWALQEGDEHLKRGDFILDALIQRNVLV